MTQSQSSLSMFLPHQTTIGILGGGQLGRMSSMAASHMGYKTIIFTPEESSPASQVSYKTIIASYENQNALKEFADQVDLITMEFENIPLASFHFLEKHAPHKIIAPHHDILAICRHRKHEKTFLNQSGIKTAPWLAIEEKLNQEEIKTFLAEGEGILKTSEFGYDGHGQKRVTTLKELEEAWSIFNHQPCILERKLSFTQEVSVIVAQNHHGTLCYPTCDNIHKDHILHQTIIPARVSEDLEKKAQDMAQTIAKNLKLRGLLCIEMFVVDNDLIVNEMAPRPHNSGHWTLDAALTSQFEQHIRAVCNLPLGATDYTAPCTMTNLLGDDINTIPHYLDNPYNKIHLYGKNTIKEKRKMGHVTTLHTKNNSEILP